MSFLNPLFLIGLAAAAIPIIIHLFTRKRPRDVRFPSLEFLTEVNQSEIRRLKIKQWLLLLLRVLAVACLALAMSRPALKGTVGPRSGAATTVVALVDRSGSMGASSGGRSTLLTDSRRVVEDLLSTLGAGDELLLVPYDRAPEPLSPRPLSDLSRLRAAVQALQPTARTTDHRAALEFAARALRESRALNRELFWISDFQTVGFPGPDGTPAEPALPEGPWGQARTYLVPLTAPSRANVGLTDAALSPSDGGAAIAVSAVAYGATAGDLAVEVRDIGGDEALGRGFLSIPERGEASTLLPLSRLPEAGGAASLPDDALTLDNRRVFAAGRAGTLRVLLREDGSPSPLRIALEAGSPASGLAVEVVPPGALAARLGDADVLVVNDAEHLASNELQAMLDFHRGGGAVLLVLGSHADARFWNGSVLGTLGAGNLGPVEQAAPGAAWRLRRVAAAHPVLAGFEARPGEALSSAQFPQVRRLTHAGARVLLEFDRAHPALIETPHALILCAPLAPEASDFAVSGAFLPLIHQAVKVLGRGTASASLVPGESYSAPASTGVWSIVDEQGREVPSELVASEGATRLRSGPLERPGLYRVTRSGALRATFAVNPDARESDLTAIPEPALVGLFPAGRAQVMRPGADLARRVREARYGRELWSWFILAALALLVTETIIGRRGTTGPAPAPAERAA